jgi:hypothetical protein
LLEIEALFREVRAFFAKFAPFSPSSRFFREVRASFRDVRTFSANFAPFPPTSRFFRQLRVFFAKFAFFLRNSRFSCEIRAFSAKFATLGVENQPVARCPTRPTTASCSDWMLAAGDSISG